MPAVVSDSSPLIYLTRLGRFSWLEELFGIVTIPQAVWDEIVRDGRSFENSTTFRLAEELREAVLRRAGELPPAS